MIKKVLSIATLCFALSLQTQVNAQNLKSEAKFWVKGSDAKSVVNLNGNYPLSEDNQGAIMAQLGDNHSNFYIVFQSFDSHSVDLADLNMKCYQQKITTQNINPQSLDVPLMEKIQSGAILKYGFNLGNYKVTDEFMLVNNVKDRTYIYEIIYMNKEFTDIDHKYLQTYLSLKYGISLIDNNNYLSNQNVVLWDNSYAPEFNKNIIGLGKSNFYDFSKNSSINSVDKLLTISSNTLRNEEYLLIGNNAKNNRFENKGSEMVLEKTYLAQTASGSEEVATLSFNTSLLENFDASKTVYLTINGETKIKGNVDKNSIVFNDVILNGKDLLSVSYDLSSVKADLADAWFLNDRGEITIKPEIKADKKSDYTVAWYFNDKLVSNKENLPTNKTGVYEMRVTSNNVTNSYQTNVYSKIDGKISNEITVYPNPVSAGEDFKISYNLTSESNVELYVYQMNGKLVDQRTLGRFNQNEFNYKLDTSGVYILISKIDGKANINKIIVK